VRCWSVCSRRGWTAAFITSAPVAEYEALKLRLAQEHGDDVDAYTAGKRASVTRVLASAGLEPGRR